MSTIMPRAILQMHRRNRTEEEFDTKHLPPIFEVGNRAWE